MILRIAASVFTGIGGHYLNRRWDKAILFLCLFVLVLVATYALFIFSIQTITISAEDIAQEFSNITRLSYKVSVTGIFVLWLVSLGVTILDYKNKTESNIVKWTKAGITGATLTSILSFSILAFTVVMFSLLSENKIVRTGEITADSESYSYSSPSSPPSFYEYLYLGGNPPNPYKLPSPPSGKGILKGKITYQEKPAASLTMAIVLNSKYKAKDIITDKDGIFTVNLPPGNWTINSIQTESWKNKPDGGSYTLYYGGEEKLKGNRYNRHAFFKRKGHPVDVTTKSNTVQINVTINKDITLNWPDSKIEGIEATIDDTISWEKYPDANQYYVEIDKIRREGTSTYYEQVTSKILADETSLPLSSLNFKKGKGNKKPEYGITIYAFAEDGTLIAQFSDKHEGGTFVLNDGNVLVSKELDSVYNLASIEDPEEFDKKMEAISDNKRRAEAVSILIDEKMLNEAELLLQRIDSNYSRGRKEVLTGYLLGLRGKCDESNVMFEKAEAINPDVCIPDSYKEVCE